MSYLKLHFKLLTLSIFGFLLFLTTSPSSTSAQGGGLGIPQCGDNIYQGRLTFCSLVCIGCEPTPITFEGCGFGQSCYLGGEYLGCQGVDMQQCDSTLYDHQNCSSNPNNNLDLLWNQPSCFAQLQGCFISYPETGGGVCVPGNSLPTYSCQNPPNQSCSSSQYQFCFDSAEEAGFTSISFYDPDPESYCDCIDNVGSNDLPPLCYFSTQQSFDFALNQYLANTIPWGDSRCPTCPQGYDPVPSEKVCRKSDASSGPTQPISFATCSDSQYCDFTSPGMCRGELAGCRFNGPIDSQVTNICGSEKPFQCETYDASLCCPDEGACLIAGGNPTTCVSVGNLTGAIDDCEVLSEIFSTTCYNNTAFTQNTLCCSSGDACQEVGGVASSTVYSWGLCKQLKSPTYKALCKDCKDVGGVWTALGCLSNETTKLIRDLSRAAIAVSGGFAVFLILVGSFQISTSTGNPERVQAGKQTIVSAIVGLMFILLSAVFLQLIGLQILQLPGL